MYSRTTEEHNVAQEKVESYSYQSNFFTLQAANNESDEHISETIIVQLSSLDQKIKGNNDVEKLRIDIANDLVKMARVLPLNLALNVLITSSQHDIFSGLSRNIITDAIEKEGMYNSPLITGEHSYHFLLQYHESHRQQFENFLKNPALLLLWINRAPALEISRLFRYYFHSESIYYINMRNLATAEADADKPGKAILCAMLMNLSRPSERGLENIKLALKRINESEHISEYTRVLKSINVIMNLNEYNICGSTDCYINASKAHLVTKTFAVDQLQGANFRSAKLDYTTFERVDLTETTFINASLSYSNLTNTNLQNARLDNANLTHATLQSADLRHASFKKATLTHANLTGAKFNDTDFEDAIFDNTIFLRPDCFHDQTLAKELTRLHAMLQDHAQAASLRTAICANIIRATQSEHIKHEVAIDILNTAYNHEIFAQHKEMHYLKLGANLAISSFFAFRKSILKTDEQPAAIATHFETTEQTLLQAEIKKQMSNLPAKTVSQTPVSDRTTSPTLL